jgi:putative transposase
MVWKASCVMDERMKFIVECQSGNWNMAEACRRASISRKTGYKWLERYDVEGLDGLKDHSRASARHPNAVDEATEQAVLNMKHNHMGFGPAKIRARLMALQPHRLWPAASTMGEILKRHGLVIPRKKRRHASPCSQPLSHCTQANDVWCADFKGWFRTGDGERCEPLTITDGDTRFLLCCQTMFYGTAFERVKPHFEIVFRQFGLPRAIRTDNGSPFASVGLCGLSRLAVWWLRLGIRPERIRPGKPQENGRHERMHRTLKQATAKPPAQNLKAQQRIFEKFMHEYNEERPHEALGQETPASHYVPSDKSFPNRLPDAPPFLDDWQTRSVRGAGHIRWSGDDALISHALRGQRIGLAPIDDGLWEIYFCGQCLGIFNEKRMCVTPLKEEKK